MSLLIKEFKISISIFSGNLEHLLTFIRNIKVDKHGFMGKDNQQLNIAMKTLQKRDLGLNR